MSLPRQRSSTSRAIRSRAVSVSPKRTAYVLHSNSVRDPMLEKLKRILANWINDVVGREKLYVRDLVMDLADGKILARFLHLLTGQAISVVPPVTATASRLNVEACLTLLASRYGLKDPARYTAEGIVLKDHASILCLLADLAKAVGSVELPSDVQVVVIVKETASETTNSTKTVSTKVV